MAASNLHIRNLPKKLQNFIENEILLYDKIDEEDIVKVFIHKEYLDKMEYHNPYFKKYINELEKIGLIKCEQKKRYICKNKKCDYYNKAISREKCVCKVICKKEFTDRYDLIIDYKKLLNLVGVGIREEDFSFKLMDEGYMGYKKSRIARLLNKLGEGEYYYVLLNKDGLKQEEISDLKLRGLPFILINLKGEVESTLEEFNNIDSYKLVNSVLKKDFSLMKSMLENIGEKALKLKLSSFEEGLKRLKSGDYSPDEFECVVFSILKIMFTKTQKWGGPKLPDGAFAIKYKNWRYGLWDAKRYNKSKLSTYIKNKGLRKDIKYMNDAKENRLIKKFGNLKDYIFVTSNTDYGDFLKLIDDMKKQIGSVRALSSLKKCNIGCINRDELIKLADFYKYYQGRLINNMKAAKIIQKSLKLNDGYFLFDNVKNELKELVREEGIIPPAKKMRKLQKK